MCSFHLARTYTHTHTHTHTYTNTHTNTFEHTRTHTHAHTHIHANTHTYTRTHTHTHHCRWTLLDANIWKQLNSLKGGNTVTEQCKTPVYRPARTPGCPVLRVCCLPPVWSRVPRFFAGSDPQGHAATMLLYHTATLPVLSRDEHDRFTMLLYHTATMPRAVKGRA